MNSREAIKLNLDLSGMVASTYLEDLTDEELMRRPHAGCNHIKWQLGHLIVSEHKIVETVVPSSMPSLPEGFADRYTTATASSDLATDFDSKADLLALAASLRTATLTTLDSLSDEALDQPSPEPVRAYAPSVGAAFSMQGGNWLMHAGQWAVVRRQLGREPIF